MQDNSLLKEIMMEVESLNRSIQEICPEVYTGHKFPLEGPQGDEMNALIEQRIKLLSERSKFRTDEPKS